jgi:hypothetical protein
MEKYLVIIIILIILIIIKYKNNSKVVQENFYTGNINNIWMYWENLPGKKKSPYLDLCYKTIKKNCSKNFKIYLLNEKNVYDYIPDLRNNLDNKMNIQQKVDYIRYILLYKYGGIWIDADTIVIKDLTPIINKLKKYDFVGFGCHFNNKEKCLNSGKPYPANWVMGARKNSKLMKLCVEKCNKFLDNNINLKTKYHLLGRETLWSEIDFLLKNDNNWNYYHYDSKCIERDSNNNKLNNNRAVSNEEIDTYCKDKLLFIPIYNSAPGFPGWFKNMNESNLLKSDMLISKIFRKSLNH